MRQISCMPTEHVMLLTFTVPLYFSPFPIREHWKKMKIEIKVFVLLTSFISIMQASVSPAWFYPSTVSVKACGAPAFHLCVCVSTNTFPYLSRFFCVWPIMQGSLHWNEQGRKQPPSPFVGIPTALFFVSGVGGSSFIHAAVLNRFEFVCGSVVVFLFFDQNGCTCLRLGK